MQFIDDSTGWVIGNNDSSVVFKTTDAGKTWFQQPLLVNTGIEALNFANENLGWIVGWSYLYTTTNGGNSWNQIELPEVLPYNGVKIFKDGLGFVIIPFSAKMYKTTDFGKTWQRMYAPVSIDYGFLDLCFTDRDNGWIIAKEWLSPNHKILRTTDSGATWQIEYEINTSYLWDIFFLGDRTGWIVGDEGIVIRTTDGGSNWSVVYSKENYYFKSVFFRSKLRGFVVGGRGVYPIIMSSNDGGSSWDSNKIWCNNPLDKIYVFDNNKAIAIGGAGTILVNNDIVVNLNEDKIDRNINFFLSQNYPNPFNPTTSIQYEISSRQFVTISVYDLLGREIATLINEEKPVGEYAVEFDGTGLPSGIYFYRIKAGSYSETRKMVLLR